ncbi:LacI family DNA-binding transcriptional regulator [Anaerocolumna chitinilytica]|uniref:Putative HTH-type transcriptional repressor ExuR n=1 Tax=Anaerocolumna chitinilytica TaxID=1727145 RepID=A0A7I8DLY5_9FIRM|nr:LacI family DNA-binding transcriptional regulator [Anaerocolumna chitinilytica]BCJ97296.1 putative HTH-type transcriptional repressor ExuR [Anaerocolumna chitinilytica]
MATIKDIAEKCSVSVSTVSKALNGYRDIGEEKREEIKKVAIELGYLPTNGEKILKTKKTYNIGVLFSTLFDYGLRNEYFAHVLASFKERAALKGYDITFIEQNMGKRSMSFLEHCRYRNFDGVFIVCADFTQTQVIELINSPFPVVTIDQVSNEAISILSDNYDGMRQLVQYIIDCGHERIAYIHGNKSSVTHNRLVGFHNTMKENGLSIPEDYMIEGIYRNSEFCEELAINLMKLPVPPTCILAPDDHAALGVMNGIRKAGLRVPEDISVAGYDGILVSQAIEPRLTTIKQDTDKIGSEAARQLINLIESPMTTSLDSVCLKVELIKGGTVRNIKK